MLWRLVHVAFGSEDLLLVGGVGGSGSAASAASALACAAYAACAFAPAARAGNGVMARAAGLGGIKGLDGLALVETHLRRALLGRRFRLYQVRLRWRPLSGTPHFVLAFNDLPVRS